MKAMKNIIVSLILIFSITAFSYAQNDEGTRRPSRAERKNIKKEEIKNLIEDKTFVFKPTHAMPMGGGNLYLNHSYVAEVNGDTLISYLPFFGVAYHAEYGARQSALDFTQPVENLNSKNTNKGYQVSVNVKNKMDHLTYTFFISDQGYATLNVNSTNRQSISFYGSIEAASDDK
jgi:hypothetical protein